MSEFIGFMLGKKTCSNCFEIFEGNVNRASDNLCDKCSEKKRRKKRRFIRTKKVFSVIKDFIVGNY